MEGCGQDEDSGKDMSAAWFSAVFAPERIDLEAPELADDLLDLSARLQRGERTGLTG